MGLFWDSPYSGSKKKVSEGEFKDKVVSELRGHDLKPNEVEDVKNVFAGHLHESGNQHAGIDAKEISQGLEQLKKSKGKGHTLSDEEINDVEQVMNKYLNK